MADGFLFLFTGVQTAVVIATGVFAWISIGKVKDSRAIEFLLNAESNFDPLYQSLIDVSSELTRNIYQNWDEVAGLSDEDVRAFPFMQTFYSQVARLCSMLDNDGLDLGLRAPARRELLNLWLRSLGAFAGHPAMQAMHESAIRCEDYNKAFMAKAALVLKPVSTLSQRIEVS
ncbi:MAG TPA: hypothetical protein VK611_17690 [Acidimicrobiales bacterium]|nr:hypothetical protein [Acidimicrobiales bacterium]